ncbi:MAG: MOSC domain-containing protein [Chloroflexia bacterium]
MSLDIDTAQSTPATQSTRTGTIRTGTIIAIAYSPGLINGVGKTQHPSAEITTWGIPGDRHYGETRYSTSRRMTLPNTRPITVLGVEATRAACEAIGIPADTVPPGGMGENILTKGLGDLGDLTAGDQVHILDETGEPKVILRVEGQNDPCVNLQFYHRLMTKQMMHRRGLLCTVLKEGRANMGDRISIVKA